ARRAVLGREGAITHARRPSLRRVEFREAPEREFVRHHPGGTLDDEVEPAEGHRDDAIQIFRQVPALAGPGSAREVEPAIDPQRAHPGKMRPPVGANRGQPVRRRAAGFPRFRGGCLEFLERARPRGGLAAVYVEVLLVHLDAFYRNPRVPRLVFSNNNLKTFCRGQIYWYNLLLSISPTLS